MMLFLTCLIVIVSVLFRDFQVQRAHQIHPAKLQL